MFEKCAAVCSVKFDDFVSDSELESENEFWKFMVTNLITTRTPPPESILLMSWV